MSATSTVNNEFYSPEQAAALAITWCAENKGWERICDIEGGSDRLYETWDELPSKIRNSWKEEYRHAGESAWLEFGQARCKVPGGYITGKGEFYSREDIGKIPFGHNIMMVFKTDDLPKWRRFK